jgi:hypothetical protein
VTLPLSVFWSSPTTLSPCAQHSKTYLSVAMDTVIFPLSLQNDYATVLTVASSRDPKEQSITPQITLQVGCLELRSSVGYTSRAK